MNTFKEQKSNNTSRLRNFKCVTYFSIFKLDVLLALFLYINSKVFEQDTQFQVN